MKLYIETTQPILSLRNPDGTLSAVEPGEPPRLVIDANAEDVFRSHAAMRSTFRKSIKGGAGTTLKVDSYQTLLLIEGKCVGIIWAEPIEPSPDRKIHNPPPPKAKP